MFPAVSLENCSVSNRQKNNKCTFSNILDMALVSAGMIIWVSWTIACQEAGVSLFSRVSWAWQSSGMWDEFMNVHLLLCRKDFLLVRSSFAGAFLSGMAPAVDHKSSDSWVGSPSAASLVWVADPLDKVGQCLILGGRICTQISCCFLVYFRNEITYLWSPGTALFHILTLF